jgi:hypothetical protein
MLLLVGQPNPDRPPPLPPPPLNPPPLQLRPPERQLPLEPLDACWGRLIITALAESSMLDNPDEIDSKPPASPPDI